MKILLILLFVFVVPYSVSAYSFITKTVDGHKVQVFHIPASDEYRVTAVASNSGTTLKSLVKAGKGVAGINGAYFLPKDYSGKPDTSNTVRIMGGDGFLYSRYYPDTGVNGIF